MTIKIKTHKLVNGLFNGIATTTYNSDKSEKLLINVVNCKNRYQARKQVVARCYQLDIVSVDYSMVDDTRLIPKVRVYNAKR